MSENCSNKWSTRKVVLVITLLICTYIGLIVLGVTNVTKFVIDIVDSTADSQDSVDLGRDIEIDINRDIENVDLTAVLDVSDVVEEVMPSMVSVNSTYREVVTDFWGQSYTQEGYGSGSGIIIGNNETELLIATNYHVISGCDSIDITFIDDTISNAYIKGTNPNMDLAVVSVQLNELANDTVNSIAVAKLGDSNNLKLGEPVIAIGNALGYGQSVTTGVISALNREVEIENGLLGRFIQTDAAINPGNSGGALLDVQGNVIGINSSKIGGSTIEGMGFAIPISEAEPIIDELSLQSTKIKTNEADRGYLGISIDERTSEYTEIYSMPKGLFVSGVEAGQAADIAGLKPYDIIVKFDTFDIENFSDLQNALQYYKAGDSVNIDIKRLYNGEYINISLYVTLGNRPN